MQTESVDRLSRALATATSRRQVLRVLLGTAASGLLGPRAVAAQGTGGRSGPGALVAMLRGNGAGSSEPDALAVLARPVSDAVRAQCSQAVVTGLADRLSACKPLCREPQTAACQQCLQPLVPLVTTNLAACLRSALPEMSTTVPAASNAPVQTAGTPADPPSCDPAKLATCLGDALTTFEHNLGFALLGCGLGGPQACALAIAAVADQYQLARGVCERDDNCGGVQCFTCQHNTCIDACLPFGKTCVASAGHDGLCCGSDGKDCLLGCPCPRHQVCKKGLDYGATGSCVTPCDADHPCKAGCCQGGVCQPISTRACGPVGGVCTTCARNEVCQDGACVCPPAQVCGSECCAPGQGCFDGVCGPPCGPQLPCLDGCCLGGWCQPGTDLAACGRALQTCQQCPPNFICVNHRCECPAAQICGGTCCAPGQGCQNGQCATLCGAQQPCPAGQCCIAGVCGCGAGGTCQNGTCSNVTCESPYTPCGTGCCDTSDSTYACINGQCVCAPGNSTCAGFPQTCCPPGTVCCAPYIDGDWYPECCASAELCCSDGNGNAICCADGNYCCQNQCCPTGNACVAGDPGPACCPPAQVCTDANDTRCCLPGDSCCPGNGGGPGCCPAGGTCCGADNSFDTGLCCLAGTTCCPQLYGYGECCGPNQVCDPGVGCNPV